MAAAKHSAPTSPSLKCLFKSRIFHADGRFGARVRGAAAINESLRDERSTLAGERTAGGEGGRGRAGKGNVGKLFLDNLPSRPPVDGMNSERDVAESGCGENPPSERNIHIPSSSSSSYFFIISYVLECLFVHFFLVFFSQIKWRA